MYEVYDRLSTAIATLVVSVVFSFDAEGLTEAEKTAMQQAARGRSLHFLPRRHFECYLIDAAAIAAFIVSKDPGSDGTVTSQAVEDAIRAAAAAPPLYVPAWNDDIANETWLGQVDAARLIVTVCGDLSEQRAPFGKKADSMFLLRHILESDRESLLPLGNYVRDLVQAVTQADGNPH